MSKGKYFMTPYIVELMQNKVPFMVFYDNHQLLEADEVDNWIADQAINGDGILAAAGRHPYMIGRHITDKNGIDGYVLKDTRCIYNVIIPDEIINQGYEAIIQAFKENELEVI